MSGDRRRWLALSAATLIAVWAFAPAGVPMYDSGGTPDEPYRYVDPPAGYRHTPAPSDAVVTVGVTAGKAAATYANTEEIGPQASLFLPKGALAAAAHTTQVTVSVTPVAPESPSPTDGAWASNVYRLAATAAGRAVPLTAGTDAPALVLRAPSSRQPGPVFEHRSDGTWQRGPRTIRIGQDIYQASVTTLGDWALVWVRHSTTKSDGINVWLLVTGVGVLAVTIAILVVRRRRIGRG